MSDDPRTFDLSTVRERARERDDAEVDAATVLSAVEDRADGERIAVDEIANWHQECRTRHQSVVEDLDDLEARFRGLLESIDPRDRERNQVRALVAEYEDHFASFRSDLGSTDDWLAAATARPGSAAALAETAARLRRCEGALHEIAHGLHHFEEELEWFETWLDDPETRVAELDEEIDGFERYLDNTEGLLDRLERDTNVGQPFDAWLAAYHLQRTMALVFEELRTDIADLDAWLDRRDDGDAASVAELRDRLDTLEARHAACSERLDVDAALIDGFERKRAEAADAIERFDAELDGREPPIDWAAVEALVQSQFDDLEIEIR